MPAIKTSKRRTWLSCIMKQASSTSWSSKQYERFGVITSRTAICFESFDSAVTRTAIIAVSNHSYDILSVADPVTSPHCALSFFVRRIRP
jgi:hypothetical protein